ncbi:nuclear transport factor 2 family protein [Ottowia sp.]|jgi:hypothetical protein|uniref:nuclear transport factor 2 family protein n=1 Tax=Ottowia sp. TaxID=1898956 RepID=UPI0025E96A11|nr:nuclear transport factor 2 family protein [Ottowia sp.]MBK6615807.1 nuclear transport factor 2 family protein [Ottowia sp.]MBK6746854.1 nuclear transport factor 2 family protein [Ottowia sp.]
MDALHALIDRYCQGWSDPDADTRARLLREVLTPDATYADPHTPAALPVDALIGHIAAVMARFPGAQVRRTSRVDVHHDAARFHWQVALAGGGTLPESVDFIDLEPGHGRIRRIVGFFGPIDPRGAVSLL